jgi:hypothetical protein
VRTGGYLICWVLLLLLFCLSLESRKDYLNVAYRTPQILGNSPQTG